MVDLMFVVHSRPWRERSVLLDVLSVQGGIYSVVAHGVRSTKPRFFIPEFSLLRIEHAGRSSLQTLTQVDLQEPLVPLVGMAMYLGLYLNELTLVLFPKDMPCPELFLAYHDAVVELRTNDLVSMELGLRQFERCVLNLCAHSPFFGLEVGHGSPIHAKGYYQLRDDSGFIEAESGYCGADLLQLNAGPGQDPHLRLLARQIFRQWLSIHRQGQPLKSRELMEQVWSQLRP